MRKRIFQATVALIVLAVVIAISFDSLSGLTKYMFLKKNDLTLSLSLVNPIVTTLAAEPSNKLVLRVQVSDKSGYPVRYAKIIFSTDSAKGSVNPSAARTDANGEYLAVFTPNEVFKDSPVGSEVEAAVPVKQDVQIAASVAGSSITSTIMLRLVKPPVVLVHGYQSFGYIFDNMNAYLSSRSFECNAINYDSEKGVKSSADELDKYLSSLALQYLAKGTQVARFDIISHSMGGLVVRYYTCSDAYIKKNNVRKTIFISVPHKGSLWASLGEKYFNNQGIRDLIPDSDLISKVLPAMLNGGLNRTIEAGNIIGQYDEVVSLDSANLEEWKINTEIFNIGENNLTVDNLLNGSILETAIHRSILNNKKVFQKVEEMLLRQLPYPSEKKK